MLGWILNLGFGGAPVASLGTGTLNDAIVEATGGPTAAGGLTAWYSVGTDGLGALEDLERKWLVVQGITAAGKTNQDMWEEFLEGVLGAGYGSLNDGLLTYWRSQ